MQDKTRKKFQKKGGFATFSYFAVVLFIQLFSRNYININK